MSRFEDPPFKPINSIVDQQGESIADVAGQQVVERRQLEREHKVASVEEAAFEESLKSKVQNMEALNQETPPEDRGREYWEKSHELTTEADILSNSGIAAGSHALEVKRQIKQHDQASEAHVDANLPAYIETATRMANSSLQNRIGQKVVQHSKADGVVGFTTVSPVNPATRNEDVAHLKPAQEPEAKVAS